MNIKELTNTLLACPDTMLDPSTLAIINKWNNPATSLEVLHALDTNISVFGSVPLNTASVCLQNILGVTIVTEGKTYDEVIAGATWRNK